MKNYLFSDNYTGEEFIVRAATLNEAKTTAQDYFMEPYCINKLTDEQADSYSVNYGVDIY